MGTNPTLFENARVTPVYFMQGQFAKDDPKLYTAPFQIVLNSEGLFLQPTPVDDVSKYLLTTTAVDTSWIQGRENIGWIQAHRPIVMDAHEMGDHEGHPSDWRGCHSFGLI